MTCCMCGEEPVDTSIVGDVCSLACQNDRVDLALLEQQWAEQHPHRIEQ